MMRASMLVLAFLTGCVVPWGVETDFFVEDLEPQDVERLADELSRYGVSYRAEGGRLNDDRWYVFTLTEIPDMDALTDVRQTITGFTRDKKVPVELSRAKMYFNSVRGTGSAEIIIRGEATPGSVVLLDVASDLVVRLNPSADGVWSHAIDEPTRLASRGGWVYAVIQKKNATQVIKINVLAVDEAVPIAADELPGDSPLRSMVE